jgi:chemotaxis protein methyltransferase CheR/type IV pilus assembly protein PilK
VAEVTEHVQAYGETRPEAGNSLLDDKQLEDWTRLLENRMGLFIAPERRSFLARGLRARMRVTGCHEFGEYYRQLSSGVASMQEWSLLVDCLTVHETCFFRHEPSMRLVEEVVLPTALQQAQHFQAWSVGCATGEEAYSLAMLADACFRERMGSECFGVTGTDISLPSLRHARSAVYLNRRCADIRQGFVDRYCRKLTASRFEIEAGLRERVCFAQLNLRDGETPPFANMNLIYCQNLLIYYDRQRRLEIVNQLAQSLRPGGVLILGPGELLDWEHPEMERVRYEDSLAYRRTH